MSAVLLAPYVALLLLSCGLRALAGTHAPGTAAPVDRAAAWLVGHDLVLGWPIRAVVGLGLGLAVGWCASRVLARWSSARPMRELNAELARGLWSNEPWVLALTAVIGGAAEEVFFRGVLQPWIGVWLSAFAFGAVHIRFRERFWLWPLLSVGFGLVASLMLVATGTLLAPIAMHVWVNVMAQRRLDRLNATRNKQRALRGLLRT